MELERLMGAAVTAPNDPLESVQRVVRLHSSRAHGSVTPECLDDGLVAALADGSADAAARARVLPHLARCGRCRQAVASVVRALADRSLRGAIAATDGGRPGRWRRSLLPLAAAAVLLVLVWSPRRTDDGPAGHRSESAVAPLAPVPDAPVGTVAGVDVLSWSPVTGADRYRATLFESSGAIRYETQLADTTVAIPDSVALVPGLRYLWKVEARTGWDRWTTSPVVEFTIVKRP